jgi:uncharacterized ParB-like nuclease family protein
MKFFVSIARNFTDLTDHLAWLGQWHQVYTMTLKWEGQDIYEGFGGGGKEIKKCPIGRQGKRWKK